MANEITLSVFFSATGHPLENQENLAGLLFAKHKDSTSHLKVGFDGCAFIGGRLQGVVFGAGTEEQAQAVQEQVLYHVKKGTKVKLNCYGHSRGGVAALLLAQKLGNLDKSLLEINLALLDTVPGNYLTTSKVDPLNVSLARQAMDLSRSQNLNRVLALYTNYSLPSIAAHGPLFPDYPESATVEEDVTTGYHCDAQFQGTNSSGSVVVFSDKSFLCFSRIQKFMKDCGTPFDFAGTNFYFGHNITHIKDIEDPEILKTCYQSQLDSLTASVKEGHVLPKRKFC